MLRLRKYRSPWIAKPTVECQFSICTFSANCNYDFFLNRSFEKSLIRKKSEENNDFLFIFDANVASENLRLSADGFATNRHIAEMAGKSVDKRT